MKIAFSTYGDSWRDQIDIRFGRAGGFFIVDTESDEISYIDNKENVATAQGAGTSAAQAIVDSGVKELVTGKVGPKAGEVLKAGGVKVLSGVGYVSIKEAYELYKQGKLTEQVL